MLTLASLGSAGQRQTGRQPMHGSRLIVASLVVHMRAGPARLAEANTGGER